MLCTIPIEPIDPQTVEDKIRKREENPDAEVEAAALKREITVTFNADVNDGMPWKFQPTQRSVKVSFLIMAFNSFGYPDYFANQHYR